MDVANASNEGYKFPVYGDYRRVGIIQDPLFDNVYVHVDSFERATLRIADVVGEVGFQEGELVYQPNSGFSGVISYVNAVAIDSTHGIMELKNIRGEYSSNSLFANGSLSNSDIVGLYTNTVANVYFANINYFTVSGSVEIVSESKSLATGELVTSIDTDYIKLTNVSGKFDANDTVYDTVSNAYANVVSIYTVNGNIDVTNSFGKKFNQTLRYPMTSNTKSFSQFEYVRQETTNASGLVISSNNEYDVAYTDETGGTFVVNDVVVDDVSDAAGKVLFANGTYMRITAASGVFANNSTINNLSGVSAFAANVFPVLVLSDVNGEYLFQVDKPILGLTSKATAVCSDPDIIVYSELIRDSGAVVYLENLEPFTLSNSSTETFKVVIKF
jgi:hypothetical protein